MAEEDDAPMFKPKETSVDWGFITGLKEKNVVEKLIKADSDGDDDALGNLVPYPPPMEQSRWAAQSLPDLSSTPQAVNGRSGLPSEAHPTGPAALRRSWCYIMILPTQCLATGQRG
jgi:hypothetical protein